MRYDDPDTPFAILIVAGTLALRDALAAPFKGQPCRLEFAADGKEAFNKAKALAFDLVITTIHLSKLDGIELLTALRQLDPHRPVIIVGEGHGEIEKVYLRCAALLGAARIVECPLDDLTFYRNARAVILQARLLDQQKV